MKRKKHIHSISLPALRKYRELIEKGNLYGFLIDSGEVSGAGSVIVRYTLKRKPWIITIEAKRRYGNN